MIDDLEKVLLVGHEKRVICRGSKYITGTCPNCKSDEKNLRCCNPNYGLIFIYVPKELTPSTNSR